MFVTYPIEATADNWIHESICYAFVTICKSIDTDTVLPTWPDMLPNQYKEELRTRRSLPQKLKTFETEAKKLSVAQRTAFLQLMEQQNQIAGLLDGSLPTPVLSEDIKSLLDAAKEVCNEGFSLLGKTSVRYTHYKIVYDSLKRKDCPFCGFEPFDAPSLHNEDDDHYLARSIYPLAAANLQNIVPMGSKCNQRYKGQIDLLHFNDGRRKALNPYGNKYADVSLINSSPFGGPNDAPIWQIDLVPDCEEVRTWEIVFSIRTRLTESVLNPYFYTWLSELPEWFECWNLNESIDNDQLLLQLDKFAAYKKRHKESGPGFLKEKVVEMLVYHCRNGNNRLITMIRSSLLRQTATA